VFAIFQVPVAVAQNLETVLICRFLVGLFGCSPLAIVGGALADFWGPVDRAVAVAFFASATFIGPIFGPILSVPPYSLPVFS
jgi:DHA1 family multidrug resistance protein-like MFS transporter